MTTMPKPAPSHSLAGALSAVLAKLPHSDEAQLAQPEVRARELMREAARQAAIVATGMSLPPGPWGLLTIVPELMSVWRIQAKLVSDIAAIHGKRAILTREAMLWCLFRHSGIQVAGRSIIRETLSWSSGPAVGQVANFIAQQLGVKLASRTLSHGIARWVPLVGATAIGFSVYWDTMRVGKSAIEAFGMIPIKGVSHV